MTFRNAIQNQAMKLASTTNAQRIQEANKANVRSTLAGMKGSGKVAEMKTAISQRRQNPTASQTQHIAQRTKKDIEDFHPEELADIMVSVVRGSLEVIYQSTRDWASSSMITGGTVHMPIAITSYGCIQPNSLFALEAHRSAVLTELQLPPFALRFANGLINGYSQSFTNWIGTLQLTGAPLFPTMGENIPWRISELPQGTALISESMMKMFMMSAGATLPPPRSGQPPAISEETVNYVAKVASGMLKFSISVSMLRNLIAVGGTASAPGAPIVGGVLVSTTGVFAEIGLNLPNPENQAMLGSVSGAVGVALRQDMVNAALKRAGAPKPPM